MRQVVGHDTLDICMLENIRPEIKTYILLDAEGKAEYKLHIVEEERWAFIKLTGSTCWSCGSQDTSKDAVEKVMSYSKVMELDTLAELKELL